MTRPWPTARASRSASSEEVPCGKSDHVAGVPGELTNHRGLEAGVHRAVLAERVLPRLPVGPVRPAPELLPGEGVRLSNQVARTLPAARRERDRAPGRASILAKARRELEEHRRRGQAVPLRDVQDSAELPLDLGPGHEDVALDGLVVVSRSDQHPFDAENVQQPADRLDLGHEGMLVTPGYHYESV